MRLLSLDPLVRVLVPDERVLELLELLELLVRLFVLVEPLERVLVLLERVLVLLFVVGAGVRFVVVVPELRTRVVVDCVVVARAGCDVLVRVVLAGSDVAVRAFVVLVVVDCCAADSRVDCCGVVCVDWRVLVVRLLESVLVLLVVRLLFVVRVLVVVVVVRDAPDCSTDCCK